MHTLYSNILKAGSMGTQEFYDSISSFYDSMVGFDAGLQKRAALLRELLPADAGNAADLGCGTGLDTAALCSLGWKVTACDLSAGMLANAKANCGRLGFTAEFVQSSLDALPPELDGRFTSAVCMGNTLANLAPEVAMAALARAGSLLLPGGALVLQLLNFTRVLRQQEKIVAITRSGGFAMVRYYEFHTSSLVFNLLRYEEENPANRTLSSSRLYPHEAADITAWCMAAGMRCEAVYGGLPGQPYHPAESNNFLGVFRRL